MLDFIAFWTTEQRTAELARGALPDSPLHPDRRRYPLRQRASVALRWLADRLEPTPHGAAPVVADCH